MTDSAPAKTEPGDPHLAGAATRLRDAAKWLVVSAGAVAAVIFAGISLTGLGNLSSDSPNHRLVLAILGAAAAVAGSLTALVTSMSLAAASTVTAHDLTQPNRCTT